MHPAFQTHILNADGLEKAKRIAELFDGLLTELKSLSPGGTREAALTVTKLEEACFYAKKNMASQPYNQGDQP